MTRVLRVFVHNWPLELAAIGLATLLYGGFVLSQSTQIFPADGAPGAIPVIAENQPENTVLLNPLPPVIQVRYFAPPGVAQPITSSFIATADLSDVNPGGGPQPVAIRVTPIDPRITILGSDPAFMTVQLDELFEKEVPIVVDRGAVPDGLQLGATAVEPTTTVVSGAKSIVERVVGARADVAIQPSGLDVDQDVRLVPIDELGDAVSPVQVEPATARVTIPVITDRRSKSVPVTPVLTGTPPPGFEIVGVTVDPQIVTLEGDADELEQLVRIDTEAIPVTGASSDFTMEAPLLLPSGLIALDADSVRVSVDVAPVTGTRNFDAGMRLVGQRPGVEYRPSTDRVLVTIGGSTADLDRLSGSDLVVNLDVTDLEPGTTTDVPVAIDLPPGLTLIAASPGNVAVAVSAPAPSPTSGGVVPSPGASPGG